LPGVRSTTRKFRPRRGKDGNMGEREREKENQ